MTHLKKGIETDLSSVLPQFGFVQIRHLSLLSAFDVGSDANHFEYKHGLGAIMPLIITYNEHK